MTWPAFFWPHKVQVRDLLGSGGMGARHASTPRELRAEVKDEQRLVRNTDGDEVVSSTQVTVPLAANVPVGSLVTVWPDSAGSKQSTVLAVARNENDLPLDSYLVLSLE